jgi:hypothetical protein
MPKAEDSNPPSAIKYRIVSRRRGCAADHLIGSVVLR